MKVIDGIRVTECVTFPRSGHTWFSAVLGEYFGPRWHYCEFHQDAPDRRIGPGSPTNFQKNHDFALDVPVLEDRQYMVQARNPLCNLPSWRRLDEEHEPAPRPPLKAETQTRLRFWHEWAQKWLLGSVPTRRIVFFEELMGDPLLHLCQTIQYLDAEFPVDVRRAIEALRRVPMNPVNIHSGQHLEFWKRPME